MLNWLHMVKRSFWINAIERLWERKSVIWLSGVRRSGKTFLCRSLADVEYFDCELPRTRRMMNDPESFLGSLKGRRVVLDEIHRLENPSELLKIAADHFPDTKVIATGSSTIGASKKFRDTLAGRKAELWLTPLTFRDLDDFTRNDRINDDHRMLHGGLPPFFLSQELPERDFQEWVDGYWAKDIQELFRLERRYSFQKCFELVVSQSGGIFEATKFSRACEVSRGTIANYLNALEATFVVHVLRPFHSRRSNEIVSAPKVYAFDSGFVCYYAGWHELRDIDRGGLWEHIVLNELHAHLQTRDIRYWRDKRGHEVDFVISRRGQPTHAIECKWRAEEFDPAGIKSFHQLYPDALCSVVAHDVERSYVRAFGGISVRFTGVSELVDSLVAETPRAT